MLNPWRELPLELPFVLEVDERSLRRYDSGQKADAKLQLSSLPEPYIGDPKTATLVLLLLNPGHSPDDPTAHAEPQFRKAILRNLRGEEQAYPFYPLNPAFADTPSAKWWSPRLRSLREKSQLSSEELSKKILAIEWFPYHSISSGLPARPVCPSQEYGFELARKAFGDGRFILRMRSRKHWAAVDSELGLTPALTNPRCGHISPTNLEPGVFEKILRVLA